MKSDSHRIRNRVTKQEKNSEKELYMQTPQNFLDDWIINNITVEGNSSFLFLQRGKWLVILERQTKGNGIFFLPTKRQINTKHLTLQGPELGPGRRHIYIEATARTPECANLWGYGMMNKIVPRKGHSKYILSLNLAVYQIRDFHKLDNRSFSALREKGLYVRLNQMAVWERSRNSVVCVCWQMERWQR